MPRPAPPRRPTSRADRTRGGPPAATGEKAALPMKFFMTSIAASLNLTAGVLGLVFPLDFPVLARPSATLSLLAIGVGLEIWAVRMLLAVRRAPPPARR